VQGLIVDWGGVLTMPIHTAIGSWLKATGVDHNHYGAVIRRWVEPLPGEISPVHRLERGELVVIATYTAMLALRDALSRLGYVGQFWED